MKKQKIALLLSAALLAAVLSGCKKNEKPVETPQDNQIESPDQSVKDNVDFPTEPVRDFVLTIEGMDENVKMELQEFDFSDLGGPTVGLYIDTERYEMKEFEGYKQILPKNSGENPIAYLQIEFFKDENINELAQNYFTENVSNESIKDNGDVKLEYSTARNIAAQSDNGVHWDGYLFETEGGVIAFTLKVEQEAIEGHAKRLLASINTIFVK